MSDSPDSARAQERLKLAAIAAALGLDSSAHQIEVALDFLDLLQRWNATYNLTAVRERESMLTQHLADCLSVVPPLARHAPSGRLLDVGSGGGLPGAVIATMLPTWEVTCVDAVSKKAAFVRQAAAALRLPNLRALHARVETLRGPAFDVVTSRAFASLADFVRGSAHLLATGGVWMAMKGHPPAGEIAALPPDVEMFHVERLDVPGLQAHRCLVWMRPRGVGATACVP